MELTNKAILVISSESWGKIFISKHHYALILAELGNKVFFLNPPDFNLKKGQIIVENTPLSPNLNIVSYRPSFPWIFKFHAKVLFNYLMKIQIKKILLRLRSKIDIVWDFNCSYIYNDLSFFNAGIRIFHPVDMLSTEARNKKADLVISVSPLILDDYKVPDVPRVLINHGLSKKFEAIANRPAESGNYNTNRIKVCYIGNLLIPSLDRDIIKDIITDHPELDFNFIGPLSYKDNNIHSEFSPEDNVFISFLQNCSNVFLKGILTQEEIAGEIANYDAFIVCYKSSKNYRCDNSHKILEYLSTGKVVISTPIHFYKGLGMIEMSEGQDDYKDLFKRVISNLCHYNTVELMNKRKAFARSNTYRQHIKQIEQLINTITNN